MNEPMMHMTAKGGYMAKGKCPTCGTTMCSIMGKDKAQGLMDSGEVPKAE